MSTITREQAELKSFITGFLTDPAHDALSANGMTAKVFRIALAVLEAEPVAYMYKDNLHSDARFSLHTRFGNWSQEDINEYEITEIPLYTAPPAPLTLPDEVIVFLNHLEDVLPDEAFNLIDVKTWNNVSMLSRPDVYRAAMLQGAEPVTTANKLPFEQWISQQTGTIDVECGCVMTEVFFHWLRVAYEAGNSPHCREILNSSTNNFRENAETSTKCPKCGGRGSYHCPQMLGTVECECTLSAPQEVAIR